MTRRAGEALDRFIAELAPGARVLDIGAGDGRQAAVMRATGFDVLTVDIAGMSDIKIDYMKADLPKFDGIWCSHVLEHAPNVGAFLGKIRTDLGVDGLLALTAPPMRTKLVGGHLNQFTEGGLVYNLIVAGFNCAGAHVGVYGYNISVLVRKRLFETPALAHDEGDIELLARCFPWPVHQGIDGRLGAVGW